MRYFKLSKFLFFLFLAFALIVAADSHAQQFDSSSFRVSNPVIAPGGYSSSGTYRLNSVLYQVSQGTSTSAGFGVNSGFLTFPTTTTPIVSATPGANQVALSWTAAVGFLGWNVGGYNYGQATVSGGPYSYANVGIDRSVTASGLTAGTTYYFVIQVKDGQGIVIATSTQVSAVPTASTTPPPPSGGGGGGGGGGFGQAVVNFSGRAYPKSTVTILKDAQISSTATAGVDGTFETSISNLSGGNYIFSVYSEDKDGRRSSLLTFPTSVTSGATTNITGIFISPTIAVDKSEVKRGDDIAIFGQSAPQADIVVSVNSEEEFFGKVISDKNGVYLYNFDTSVLDYGAHSTKSKSAIGNQLVSSYSYLINFKVGTKNVAAAAPVKCPEKADLNSDCRVNLVDFSIAAFWYKRALSIDFTAIEKLKLNGDGKVTLVDFSIMAYYWTG